MPYTIRWANDKALLLITYAEPLAVADFIASQEENYKLLDEVSQPVDVIVDMRAVRQIPLGAIGAMPKLGHHPSIVHPHIGRIVVVIASPIVETISGVFSRIYLHLHVARTLEQAYQHLGIDPPG